MSGLLSNSALFAVLVAILFNNYLETGKTFLQIRAPLATPGPAPAPAPSSQNDSCPANRDIYAFGDESLLVDLGDGFVGGPPGWENVISRGSPIVQTLYLTNPDGLALPELAVGYAIVSFGDVLEVSMASFFNQSIFCDFLLDFRIGELKGNATLDDSSPQSNITFKLSLKFFEGYENFNTVRIILSAKFCPSFCYEPPIIIEEPLDEFCLPIITQVFNITTPVFKSATIPQQTATQIDDKTLTMFPTNTLTENSYITDFVTTTTVATLPKSTTTLTYTEFVDGEQVTKTTTSVVPATVSTKIEVYQTIFSTTTEIKRVATTVCVPKPTHTPPCIDFGSASPFNLYVARNYSGESDVQGRLAVGQNATLKAGFSVGDQFKTDQKCLDAIAIVGGAISGWETGRLYLGTLVYGSNSSSFGKFVLENGCSPVVNPKFFDFPRATYDVKVANNFICGLHQTVKSLSVSYGTLEFALSGNKTYEVVDIADGNFFNGQVNHIKAPQNYVPGKTHSRDHQITSGSVLIFNIHGKTAGIVNVDMEQLKDHNVIFNFCEATDVTIGGVAVRGWVVAPYANIKDATGVIWGSTFVRSLTGSIQINVRPIPICYNQHAETKLLVECKKYKRIGEALKSGSSPTSKPSSFLWMWLAVLTFFGY